MKQFTLYLASVAILLSTAIINAAPLKLPSRSQLIKIIKKADHAGIGVTGLRSYKYCDKVSINSVKILKVGRASSNYYKESGNYISTSFMVKLKATGSCSFDSTHTGDFDDDGREDRISGTLPIINEPLEIGISTDSYGDWKARSLSFAGKNINSTRIKEHLKRIYLKGKAAMGGRYSYVTIINNISSGQGNGVYYDAFAVSNKRSNYSRETNVQRAFGSDYRSTDWKDLINYSNNGSVLELFKHLGISSQDGALITYGGRTHTSLDTGYYAVHCSTFNSEENRRKVFPNTYMIKFKKEPLCLANLYGNKRARTLAVKISAYGTKPSINPQKRSTTANNSSKRSSAPSRALTPFNTNKNPSQPAMTKDQRLNEVFAFFKKRPKAYKIFRQQPKEVRFRLFKSIYERKTKQARYRAFLNVANNLENGGKQRSPSGSNSHSHGGRIHTHKLPPQGKSHRHNNGPIGR